MVVSNREYCTISCLFGVGLLTVCKLVRQVTNALVYQLFISLPTGQRRDETIAGFQERGYPQCTGTIDGTYIPIIAPRDNPADYYSREGWHSIVLQAVVDHNLCNLCKYNDLIKQSKTVKLQMNIQLKISDNIGTVPITNWPWFHTLSIAIDQV